MLITHEVEIGATGNNKIYYKNLGYDIPVIQDNHYRWITPKGTKIKVKVEDLPNSSMAQVLYSCDGCDEELTIRWVDYLKHKHGNNYYCMSCSNKLFGREKRKTDWLKTSKSFEQWCIENNRQDVLDRWDYDLNNCSPNEITYRTHNKYYFSCPNGIHNSELKDIAHFTEKVVNITCNACNSFAQWGIDNISEDFLEKYWSDKNKLNPWEINKATNKKIWIKCQEKDYHEDYETTTNLFYNGKRCPYCAMRKVHAKDSLGQHIINNFGQDFLDKIWSDKNKKSFFEYSPSSKTKVWWKCLDNKHEEYERVISNSMKYNFRCPKCVQEMEESILQEKVRLYLEKLSYTILHEENCTVVPINPKTNRKLPFDNEIRELKLICEVNGVQHYKLSHYHKLSAKRNNITPAEELHYQQLKDRYKRIFAKQQGYEYLEIPYWTDNKNKTWKQLIDDKINEIFNKNKL